MSKLILKRHLRKHAVHTKLLQWKGSSKSFEMNSKVKRLFQRSPFIKVLRCKVCMKKFSSMQILRMHLKSFHNTLHVKKFRKSDRSQSSKNIKKILKSTKMSNTSFREKCFFCNVFVESKLLKLHMARVHSKRSHKCGNCD